MCAIAFEKKEKDSEKTQFVAHFHHNLRISIFIYMMNSDSVCDDVKIEVSIQEYCLFIVVVDLVVVISIARNSHLMHLNSTAQ